MKPKYVYHWTHRKLLNRIARQGLDPSFSNGRMLAVWVCDEKRIAWALGHTASNHGWDADEIVCIRIKVCGIPLRRTANTGVYNCITTITPDTFDAVLFSIGEGWVEW